MKDKLPRMVLMWCRKIVTFQINEKMGAKHFKVIFDQERDSENRSQFNQSDATDLLCCSREVQAGRIGLRGSRKAV